jgi:alpha-galactosidase
MNEHRLARWMCLNMSWLAVFFAASSASSAATAEIEAAGWIRTRFGADAKLDAPPFSFTYGGKSFADWVKQCDATKEHSKLDEHRTRHVHAYSDPQTGLTVRCEAIEYHDFPILEWTLYFKNVGAKDTAILEDIQPLDTRFERPEQGEFLLHHHRGSSARPEDYQPLESTLPPKSEKLIASFGGRGSNGEFPYFNVEWPASATEAGPTKNGVIVAVGWPGQWQARFTRDEAAGLRIRAGQELTHFLLHPGEEVRTPLVALQFWNGDWIGAQNTWRRWMLAHNLPRPGGKLAPPQLVACSSHQFGEMIRANEANQKLFIDRYLEEDLRIDYWWMDAGWYKNDGTWVNTGTWEVDTKRFPNGLRAITDHAHGKGVKSIVWFEPERVTPGTWLFEQHPEWLLKAPPNPGDQAYAPQWQLLDLGNPAARGWLIEHVDGLIKQQGIDLYRQDFNMDPLFYWRAHDASDRQGITEINYVTGYLAYWDELRRRHPNLLIDSCASGGRRNDLETLRRAVPLLRSDHLFEPTGQQCHFYGISMWIPYHGTGTLVGPSDIIATPTAQVDPYIFRSHMSPSVTACWDMRREDLDYEALRRLTKEFRRIAPHYFGDYYPLTPYDATQKTWMAWQFHNSAQGEGMVQAFRRAENDSATTTFKLTGLDPDATYIVSDVDHPESVTETSGSALLEHGLSISIVQRPGAVILTYRRK